MKTLLTMPRGSICCIIGFSLTERWSSYPSNTSLWLIESPTKWMLAPITKITTHNILNVDDVFLELLSKSWNIICKKTMTNASASQWLHSDPFYIFNPGYLVGSFSFLVLWLFFAFVCIRSVYYVLFCLCLWIVHSWLPLSVFSSVYLLGVSFYYY